LHKQDALIYLLPISAVCTLTIAFIYISFGIDWRVKWHF